MKNKKVKFLFRNHRAVSIAITSVIMTSTVLVLGFVVLNWASFRTEIFNKEFSEVIDENVDKLKEKIVFEYIFYNSSDNSLFVYLLNYGNVDNVNITNVYITTASGSLVGSFRDPVLLSLSDDLPIYVLNATEEGYFKIEDLTLQVDSVYNIKIITRRGVKFDELFIA